MCTEKNVVKFKFSELTKNIISSLVFIENANAYNWEEKAKEITLSKNDENEIKKLTQKLTKYPAHSINEATLWNKMIYPLLELVECDKIMVASEVPLSENFKKFELSGEVDGLIGTYSNNELEMPYFVVTEAKSGIGGKNPKYQLIGELLAVGKTNQNENNQDKQEIFGCYIIADSWVFIRATICDLNEDKPKMKIETSREFDEKFEAHIILAILKSIV